MGQRFVVLLFHFMFGSKFDIVNIAVSPCKGMHLCFRLELTLVRPTLAFMPIQTGSDELPH